MKVKLYLEPQLLVAVVLCSVLHPPAAVQESGR